MSDLLVSRAFKKDMQLILNSMACTPRAQALIPGHNMSLPSSPFQLRSDELLCATASTA
jgi:hypothetical protein